MVITVKMFGTYIKYLPRGGQGNTVDLEVPLGIKAVDVISMIQIPDDDQKVILLNGSYVDLETALKDGDVLAIFQAIAGGN
jgi:sulfur carrier protein ThiS